MRWMVVTCAVALVAQGTPKEGWAKPNPNWHVPKCSASTSTPGNRCPHDAGATITAIVAVDYNQVVLVEPDPLIVCRGDTVVWVLVNACDEKKAGCKGKKIKIDGPASMGNVFMNCVLNEITLDEGQVDASSICTVLNPPKYGVYKYNIKGSHACDPEVDVREGGKKDTTTTTTTTTTTLPH